MTASILKQDPNTQTVKKKHQHHTDNTKRANVQGHPFRKAAKQTMVKW